MAKKPFVLPDIIETQTIRVCTVWYFTKKQQKRAKNLKEKLTGQKTLTLHGDRTKSLGRRARVQMWEPYEEKDKEGNIVKLWVWDDKTIEEMTTCEAQKEILLIIQDADENRYRTPLEEVAWLSRKLLGYWNFDWPMSEKERWFKALEEKAEVTQDGKGNINIRELEEKYFATRARLLKET